MSKKFSIGIDPSFSTMGAAIYHFESKKIRGMKTGEFQAVVNWINENVNLDECVAVVENPALDKTTFGMWGIMQKDIEGYVRSVLLKVSKIPSPKGYSSIMEVQSQFSICMNHAQKVGENKAAAKLIISMLEKKGVPTWEVAPSDRDKAFAFKRGTERKEKVEKEVRLLTMPTKTTKEQFKTLTGYEGVCSEHSRDAATLIWGKSLLNIENNILMAGGVVDKKKPKTYPKTANHNFFLVKKEEKKPDLFT